VLAGVGDDAAIVKISDDLATVTHLDVITPITDDPYVQGKIAACNAASDVYSKGATDIISALVILGVPSDIPKQILTDLMRGFRDFCAQVSAPIAGGHTMQSEMPFMGGAITAVQRLDKLVYNSGAKAGDVLVLTKLLGMGPIMAIASARGEKKGKALQALGERGLKEAVDRAVGQMTTPNRAAAQAMVEARANACTDVTGFGLLGHAEMMAKASGVRIRLNRLPVIRGAVEISSITGQKLASGRVPETSGGLLISMPRDRVGDLLERLKAQGVNGIEVGSVEAGAGVAQLDNAQIVET